MFARVEYERGVQFWKYVALCLCGVERVSAGFFWTTDVA